MTTPPKITVEPTTDERLQAIEDQQMADSQRMKLMDAEMKLNTEATTRNTELTQDIRDLLAAFKGGFRVLGWLGTGAKWLGSLAVAAVAIWVAIYTLTHGGVPPK